MFRFAAVGCFFVVISPREQVTAAMRFVLSARPRLHLVFATRLPTLVRGG
jgi:hypothetical protein